MLRLYVLGGFRVERDALADLHLRLPTGFARLLEARGLPERAVEHLQQALRHDPGREEVHRALMRLYAASGRRQEALQQYRLCRAALREQYDIEPEPETEALYEAIRAGKVPATRRGPPGAWGAERAAPASAPVLPPPLSATPAITFVGRERPLDLLLRDLFGEGAAGRGRSVALLGGEAGVGKTRLAADAEHAISTLESLGSSWYRAYPLLYLSMLDLAEGQSTAGLAPESPARWCRRNSSASRRSGGPG